MQVEVEVDARCSACDGQLEVEDDPGATRLSPGQVAVRIGACERCLNEARTQSYDDGVEEGRAEGDK